MNVGLEVVRIDSQSISFRDSVASFIETISNLLEEPPIVDLVVPPGQFVCVYPERTQATFNAQTSPVTHSHRVVLSISHSYI